jgi:hypothetical protein
MNPEDHLWIFPPQGESIRQELVDLIVALEKQRMPIDKPYAYHKPSPEGMDKINKLREHFSTGERLIKEICGNNRQSSIAITNNEQTAMWAIKAVVFNDPMSVTEE